MKKFATILVLIAGLSGLARLLWFKPPATREEEAAPATEVAVHVGKITRATLRGFVTAYGTVEPEPAGDRPAASARVAPAIPGVITEVNCAEGRRVAKGDVLFQLDSRATDVVAAFAEKTLERQAKLARVDGTSQKILQEAQQQLDTARVQQALLRVQSPLAGTVTRVNAKAGEAVDLTSVLAVVVDLNRLIVGANVPSTELTSLKPGQSAEVLADQSDQPVKGSLTYIGAEVDSKTGTAPVRVALPRDSGLRPGQFVTVRITSAEHKNCLAVPIESVAKDEAGATVISVVQNDTAAQKPVKTGLSDEGWVEVEGEGLEEGMTIVTVGAYALPEETKIRILGK